MMLAILSLAQQTVTALPCPCQGPCWDGDDIFAGVDTTGGEFAPGFSTDEPGTDTDTDSDGKADEPAPIDLGFDLGPDTDSDGIPDQPAQKDTDSDGIADIPVALDADSDGVFDDTDSDGKVDFARKVRRSASPRGSLPYLNAAFNQMLHEADDWQAHVRALVKTTMSPTEGNKRRREAVQDYRFLTEDRDFITEEVATILPSFYVDKLNEGIRSSRLFKKEIQFEEIIEIAQATSEFEKPSFESQDESIFGDRPEVDEVLEEKVVLSRNAQEHVDEFDTPGWDCTVFHVVYMTVTTVPFFYLTDPPQLASYYSDLSGGSCSDFISPINRDTYALLKMLLEAVDVAIAIADYVCDVVGQESCLPKTVLEAVKSVLELFEEGVTYHLGMDHTVLLEYVHHGMIEIKAALNCSRADWVPHKFMGCDGLDDDCDDVVDNAEEDQFAPTLIPPPPGKLGWFKTTTEAEEAMRRYVQCYDDCDGDVQIVVGSAVISCDGSFIPVSCTDKGGNVDSRNLPILIDSDVPQISMCVETGKDILRHGDGWVNVGFSYNVTDSCLENIPTDGTMIEVTMNAPLVTKDKDGHVTRVDQTSDFFRQTRKENGDLVLNFFAKNINKDKNRVYQIRIFSEDASGNDNEAIQTVTVMAGPTHETEIEDFQISRLARFPLTKAASGGGCPPV